MEKNNEGRLVNGEQERLNNLAWPECDLKDIDEKYVCPKCKKVMENVHQADDCGCRYCLECLNEM